MTIVCHNSEVSKISTFPKMRKILRNSVPTLSNFVHAQEKDAFWLARLNHKDWLSPNEFLKVFMNLKNPNLLITAFEKATSRIDYKPSEALYIVLVERFASAKKFDLIDGLLENAMLVKCQLSDDFFYRVIKIYGNMANHANKAVETLFQMPDFHCWPTVKTFNYVLNMLVCGRHFEVIHEVYLEAPRLGVSLDTCCFNILIKGLCQCDRLDTAYSLLGEIPKQGCRPNATTYSTLMHALCKHNDVDGALELCESMEKNGCYPDSVAYNILISGLCKQGRFSEATGMLRNMQLKGCYPNSGTYQALLYGFLDAKKFMEARDLLTLAISKGSRPSYLSYKLIVHGLCSEELVDDACAVLKLMVSQGFVPQMGTWKTILARMF